MLAVAKKHMPWWAKILSKMVVSRLPAKYPIWQRLGIFRHGQMDKTHYALRVFQTHVTRSGLEGRLGGKVLLELGPGDSVATAVIARAFGAKAILVDTGEFATHDLAPYIELAGTLHAQGLEAPDVSQASSVAELVDACAAAYFAAGLSSLRSLPAESVDLIFSQAVLEHIRREDFLQTMLECSRILKPGGVCSHRVDLKDHLGGGLNNLRFSKRLWESGFFVKSGFYTNRIQYEDMLELFRQANLDCEVLDVQRWGALPIKRRHLATEFRTLPDEALLVSGFDVLLRRSTSR